MTLAEHVERHYPADYLGLQPISAKGPVDGKMSIVKAYLGSVPSKPFFGQILAVLRYGDRFFALYYHVWSPHQRPAMANRMTELQELVVRNVQGHELLEKTDTDFAGKAFWMRTPDTALDEESLSLRAAAKKLKAYSVENRLCGKFRRSYKD